MTINAPELTGEVGNTMTPQIATCELGLDGGTWESTDLPEGITIDEQTGEISGTPVKAGEGDYTVTYTYGAIQTYAVANDNNNVIISGTGHYNFTKATDETKPTVTPNQPSENPTETTQQPSKTEVKKATVKTGDNESYVPYIIGLVVALCAIVVLILKKRKS